MPKRKDQPYDQFAETEFGDDGAGPEEPDDVIDDPENQAAAAAIRESTIAPEEE